MSRLTKKQIAKQEAEYAREMLEIQRLDRAAAEKQILREIEEDNFNDRTCGGIFEDAYGGPIVVSDDVTKYLAERCCA